MLSSHLPRLPAAFLGIMLLIAGATRAEPASFSGQALQGGPEVDFAPRRTAGVRVFQSPTRTHPIGRFQNPGKDTTMQIVSSDGTVISVRRSGSGPALLLIHGTTADHQRWLPILPRFEQHFTVYAMDRRGRGGSGDSPDYDLMREAKDVAAVVEAVGGPVFVLAHSYGAICGLEATRLTDRIARLVLYEPPIPTGLPLYPPGLPDRMQALIDSGESEAALEVFFLEVVRMPGHELEVFRKLPMWEQRIRIAPTLPRELAVDRSYSFDPAVFADVQVPTLLLLGSDSPPLSRQAVEVVDAALPNSSVVLLPGQQHIAMDTDPELFVREVLQFLLN
jgi:pimeloyl-ACP methyl ester carboxylesterase